MPTTSILRAFTSTAIMLASMTYAAPRSLAQTPTGAVPDVVQHAKQAVVLIRAYNAQGRESGLGSGFLLQDGRIVTNAHVVAGAARLEVFDAEGRLLGTTQHAVALSSSVDLAVLPRLSRVPGWLPIATTPPRDGEAILAIGAPQGLANTVSNGIVSAAERNLEGMRLMQITAPISQGSSGGPVLNLQGEVVGVSVGLLREGQNLNFAVPLDPLRAILASPSGRVVLAGANRPPTRASSSPGTAAPTREGRGSGLGTYIRMGQTLHGVLTRGDFARDDGRYMRGYVFAGRRDQKVVIAAQSSEFDTYLMLFRRSDLRLIDSDDDSGDGTDSRLLATLPSDGEYVIIITSYRSGQLGRFTLSLGTGSTGTTPSGGRAEAEERWIPAAESDEFYDEIDRTRLSSRGNGIYRAWLRRSWDSPTTDRRGETYDSEMVLYDYDCHGRRVRLVGWVEYLGTRIVYSSPAGMPPGEWSSVVPDSVGEGNLLVVCAEARRQLI